MKARFKNLGMFFVVLGVTGAWVSVVLGLAMIGQFFSGC